MIRTFALNPFVGIQIAALLQTLLLAGLILGLDQVKPNGSLGKSLLQGLGSGFYTIFGLLFLDIAVLWLAGAWTYADWRFQLPSVILILVLGLFYLIKTEFAHGRIINFIVVALISLILGLFLHWWVPRFEVMGLILEQFLGLMVGIFLVVLILLNVMIIVLEQRGSQNFMVKRHWDIEPALKKIYTRKIHIILWLLSVMQAMLTFLGYSLFSF
jgi:hypothetical protein